MNKKSSNGAKGAEFHKEHIAPFLKKQHMSIAQFAKHVHTNPVTIYLWRAGKYSPESERKEKILSFIASYRPIPTLSDLLGAPQTGMAVSLGKAAKKEASNKEYEIMCIIADVLDDVGDKETQQWIIGTMFPDLFPESKKLR